jgi:hypothetical protein
MAGKDASGLWLITSKVSAARFQYTGAAVQRWHGHPPAAFANCYDLDGDFQALGWTAKSSAMESDLHYEFLDSWFFEPHVMHALDSFHLLVDQYALYP